MRALSTAGKPKQNVWLENGLQDFPSLKSCHLEQIIIIAAMETVCQMEEDIQESDLLHFRKNQLMKIEQDGGPNLCAETILMSTALQRIAKFVNFTFQKMWILITGYKY